MSGASIGASPGARELAAAEGVELAGLVGTGPAGRITRRDVEAAISLRPLGRSANGAGGALAGPHDPEYARVGMSRAGLLVARRMATAKATIPEFFVEREVDVSALLAVRELWRESGASPVPSLNDVLIFASARALRQQPRINARYDDGGIVANADVNVCFAVAADNLLVAPVVQRADTLTLLEITERTRELSARVRAGRIEPSDLDGGTFTISNLGMLGVDRFSAIISTPQVAILSVGRAARRPVVDDSGNIAVRSVMSLTVNCDHRVVYGAHAGEFLQRIDSELQAVADAG